MVVSVGVEEPEPDPLRFLVGDEHQTVPRSSGGRKPPCPNSRGFRHYRDPQWLLLQPRWLRPSKPCRHCRVCKPRQWRSWLPAGARGRGRRADARGHQSPAAVQMFPKWKKTHPDGSMNEFVSDNKDYLPKGREERLTSVGDTTDLKPGSAGGGSKSTK